jgi:CRISPR-associated endonuclease Csn1
LIGNCEFYENEKKAPKTNYYAEEFNFLNDFINIGFVDPTKVLNNQYIRKDGNKYKLNKDGLEAVKNYILENKKVSIKSLFDKVLGTTIENIYGYRVDRNSKPEFSTFSFYKYIKNQFSDNNFSTDWIDDVEQYNKITYILTIAPGTVEIKNMIQSTSEINYHFFDEEIELLGEIRKKKSTDLKYHALSEKALKRAITDMLKYMMNFSQIKEKLNYDKEIREKKANNYTKRKGKLPLMEERKIDEIIASPGMKKALRQSIKVINAIIKEQGNLPKIIAIESTKEMNGTEKKNQLLYEQRVNEKLKEEAKQIIISAFGESFVTAKNIEKVMLYKETNGHCIYCNKPLNLSEVISGICEVEHILPLSKSFEDAYDNKTISCKDCNSSIGKGNRTPYNYLITTKGSYDKFKDRVEKLNISSKKKENLLFTGDIDKYELKFINRNLRDTAYATTELIKQINDFNDYIELNYDDLEKIKTLSTPGQLTRTIRDKHALEKDRNVGVFHHAVDASIVAAITSTDIGKIILEAQNNKQFYKKYKKLTKKLSDLLRNINLKDNINEIRKINEDNIHFSHQVKKNPQGQLANANLYKVIEKDNNLFKIQQIDNIYDINIKDPNQKKKLESLFDEKNNNEVLLCYENNKELFNYLREIYEKYKNDNVANPFVAYCRGKPNFSSEEKFDYLKHGIRVPSKRNNGPIVKTLRYYTVINDPYLLEKKNIITKPNTKIALDSLSQMCTRIYIDIESNKFAFLPIYSISVDLNTKKIKEDEYYYKEMYKKYIGNKRVRYLTDIYDGDLIEIVKKDGSVISGLYKCFHKTNNRLCLKNGGYFTTNDKEFTIYVTDVLGNKKEKKFDKQNIML